MSSFVKWVGGKGRAMPYLLPILQDKPFGRYHEPFLGGGAVFLRLRQEGVVPRGQAVLGDVNGRLVDAWRQVRAVPEDVIDALRIFADEDSEELFLHLREIFNEEPSTWAGVPGFLAAVFIYLNRACFNGLYRENKKGHFNASFAKPPLRVLGKNICVDEAIRDASRALQGVSVLRTDFSCVVREAEPQDLVYADPPYHRASQQTYTAGDFTEDDQRRLARELLDAAQRGVEIVASNADTPLIRALYKDFTILSSRRPNTINTNTSDRVSKRDVVITTL